MTINVQNVYRWLTYIPVVAFRELTMAFSGNADQIN